MTQNMTQNISDLEGVIFDYGRVARIGLPEAVFCEKKPFSAVKALLEKFSSGDTPILFTRLDKEIFASMPAEIRDCYNFDAISKTAFAATMQGRYNGNVAVISAGTADLPVSRECSRTLEYLGIEFSLFEDCGISALWRIIQRLEKINSCSVIVVIAGMEGALASVVGGLCARPIFAVPTSVGYGASAGGKAALYGMLASCAPGITVLNIDNGYGAACAAARVLRLL